MLSHIPIVFVFLLYVFHILVSLAYVLLNIRVCSPLYNLQFDLNLLLNPFTSKLNNAEAREVAKEFEVYLNKIDFTL